MGRRAILPTVIGIVGVLIGVVLTTLGVTQPNTNTLVAPGALLITVSSAFLGVYFARTGVHVIPPAMKSTVDGDSA